MTSSECAEIRDRMGFVFSNDVFLYYTMVAGMSAATLNGSFAITCALLSKWIKAGGGRLNPEYVAWVNDTFEY